MEGHPALAASGQSIQPVQLVGVEHAEQIGYRRRGVGVGLRGENWQGFRPTLFSEPFLEVTRKPLLSLKLGVRLEQVVNEPVDLRRGGVFRPGGELEKSELRPFLGHGQGVFLESVSLLLQLVEVIGLVLTLPLGETGPLPLRNLSVQLPQLR